MRILLVTHAFDGPACGGVGRHVRALAGALEEAGHTAFVLARVSDSDRPDLTWFELSPRNYRWNHRGEAGRSFRERTHFLPAEAEFSDLIHTIKPDLVSIHHTSYFSLGVASIARDRGVPFMMTLHDFVADCPRGQRYRPDDVACLSVDRSRCATCVTPRLIELVRGTERVRSILAAFLPSTDRRLFAERDAAWLHALEFSAAVVVPSDSTRTLLRSTFPAAMDSARVLAPFIEVPWPSIAPPEVGSSRTHRIGYFGSTSPSKGVDIAAMAAVRSKGQFELHVFGNEPSEFQASISARAGSAVVWHGPYDPESLPAHMAAVDAVVIPSRWPETYNLVLREAGLLGRAVVASRLGALNEACDRGWAMGVEPGDPDALLRTWITLAANRFAAPSIRADILAEFSRAREQTVKLYEQVAQRGKTVA